MSPTKKLLKLDDVVELTGLSSTTIYKYMKTNSFPKPKKIGSRAVRWRYDDIISYIESD